jgi:hypothetical protein
VPRQACNKVLTDGIEVGLSACNNTNSQLFTLFSTWTESICCRLYDSVNVAKES